MNELVSQVRATLKGKTGVGLRIPYWLGLILGHTKDLVVKLSGKNTGEFNRVTVFCINRVSKCEGWYG